MSEETQPMPMIRQDTRIRTNFFGPLDTNMFPCVSSPWDLIMDCDDEHVVNNTPALYLASRVNSHEAFAWRRNFTKKVTRAGWFNAQSFVQDELFRTYDFTTMNEVIGRGFTLILAADGIVTSEELGIYSMAEYTLGKMLDLPIWINEVPERQELKRIKRVTAEKLTKLSVDNESVWEHMQQYKRELSTRYGTDMDTLATSYDPAMIRDLQITTYWQYICAYLHGTVPGDTGKIWLRKRMQHDLHAYAFPLLQSIHPKHMDTRLCLATIDDNLRLIDTGAFQILYGRVISFWHSPQAPVFCQATGIDPDGTLTYSSVPDKQWDA